MTPRRSGYYLSAFLSAARSVTFVLQVEDKEGYDRIFPPWRDSLPQQDRDLLDTMNQFRKAEVHLKGVTLTPTTALIPLKEGRPGEFEPMVLDWKWLMEAQQRGVPTEGWGMVVLVPRFNVSGQPAEVIATCQRYVALLADLLGHWT